MLDEYDEDLNQGEAYIVQNWLLLARIRYHGESRQVDKLTSGFDWDQLKILKRVMQSETARIRNLDKQEMQSLLEGASIKKWSLEGIQPFYKQLSFIYIVEFQTEGGPDVLFL